MFLFFFNLIILLARISLLSFCVQTSAVPLKSAPFLIAVIVAEGASVVRLPLAQVDHVIHECRVIGPMSVMTRPSRHCCVRVLSVRTCNGTARPTFPHHG